MLPFVMAAYRSSSHQSTNYSPNYLMFAREVRAPADLVFGTLTEQAPTSYDDYSAAMESRMRQAYGLVRQELGVNAERMKRHYDLRVRPQKFRTGEWVLYYNPRSYQEDSGNGRGSTLLISLSENYHQRIISSRNRREVDQSSVMSTS